MKNISVVELNLNNYGTFFTLVLNNKLFVEITRYFLWKIHNSNRRGMLAFSTQRLYLYDVYNFFKLLYKFGFEWDTVTSKDIRRIRDYLDQTKKDRNPINRKTNIWVEFYQWCIDNNIEVIYKSKYKRIKRKSNMDDNFLSHVSNGSDCLINEFYLSPLRAENTYKVLTEDEFNKLKIQLRMNDIMYEAIAITMITTGLRIGEVLQLRNITFPPSNILSNKESLEYSYVPKGERSTGKKVSCTFPFETWEYISTVIFKARNHILKSNKKKSNYLFIDKKGKEIKAHHVQKRFRELYQKKILEKYSKGASRYAFSKVLPQVNEKILSKLHIQESLEYLKKEGYE